MNEINKLLKDKSKLTERISIGLDIELKRQKKAGKKFLSDDEIDNLIANIIKEELGDAQKEHYMQLVSMLITEGDEVSQNETEGKKDVELV